MSATKRRVLKPRRHLSLALRPDQVEGIERIQGWAERDPHFSAISSREVGLQTAILYAIAIALKNPPAHVEGEG